MPRRAQGEAVSQYNLGVGYQRGQGVAQDTKRAVEWYTKAAAQGEAGAQFNLGIHYERGQGVAQDFKQALNWFGKAAAQGVAKAAVRRDACLLQLFAAASAGHI